MSSDRAPKSGQREASSVTRLSTRRGKPSEHVVRKCCACIASPSSRGDQRMSHRSSGDGCSSSNSSSSSSSSSSNSSSKAAAKKKPCLKTSDQDDDTGTKSQKSGSPTFLRLSKERDAVKSERDGCGNKPGTSGKGSDSVAQRKSRVAEVESRWKTSTEKQRGVPPNNVPKSPPISKSGSSPAQAGLSSKQAPKKACSSPNTTTKLKKPPPPKSSPPKEPQGQPSQGKKKVQCEIERQPTASKSQKKLSSDSESDSDSDSDSEASGSDCSYDDTSDTEHHITADGSDRKIGKNCGFCNKDLGAASWEEDEHEAEFCKLPVVSILCCGHAFHSYCLDSSGLPAKEGDPPCVLCQSISNC